MLSLEKCSLGGATALQKAEKLASWRHASMTSAQQLVTKTNAATISSHESDGFNQGFSSGL